MKCNVCEVCGKKIYEANMKLCIPLPVGTYDGASQFCWCLCDECKGHFIQRSHRVLEERPDI